MTSEELIAAYNSGQRDFRNAYLRNAYLGNADLGGADLRGADLRGAYLGGADLGGAYLGGADLGGAYLRNAYLRNAYLRGADLRNAYLRGADLGAQWVIQGPCRSDGYYFMLTNLTGEGVRVKAGCRNFTIKEAKAHWTKTRKNTPLGNETFAILDCLVALAKARGYKI
jgi:uncharacterized protein YjbI with pentapeptide repeats